MPFRMPVTTQEPIAVVTQNIMPPKTVTRKYNRTQLGAFVWRLEGRTGVRYRIRHIWTQAVAGAGITETSVMIVNRNDSYQCYNLDVLTAVGVDMLMNIGPGMSSIVIGNSYQEHSFPQIDIDEELYLSIEVNGSLAQTQRLTVIYDEIQDVN